MEIHMLQLIFKSKQKKIEIVKVNNLYYYMHQIFQTLLRDALFDEIILQ